MFKKKFTLFKAVFFFIMNLSSRWRHGLKKFVKYFEPKKITKHLTKKEGEPLVQWALNKKYLCKIGHIHKSIVLSILSRSMAELWFQ